MIYKYFGFGFIYRVFQSMFVRPLVMTIQIAVENYRIFCPRSKYHLILRGSQILSGQIIYNQHGLMHSEDLIFIFYSNKILNKQNKGVGEMRQG